jgi:hypothetical protein
MPLCFAAQHDVFILMPTVLCFAIIPPVFYATRTDDALLQYDYHHSYAAMQTQ